MARQLTRYVGSNRPWRFLCAAAGVALFVAITFTVVMSTALPAAAGGPSISGVGSSYAALAIIQWDAEVSSEFGDTVNYLTQSSVIGLNDFANYPQVDFGASEIGYSTGQSNSSPPPSFQYQYLPDIAGATCLDFNVTSTVGSSITNLKLNSQVLAGIFSGTITEWDDPAIQALNPGVLLPHNAIIVVFRSDASGDNFIFSDYLETEQPGLWNAFTSAVTAPTGAAAIWPQPPSGQRSLGQYNFGNFTSENGSDTASDYVYANPNTITYVETGYALLHHDPCAEIANSSGSYVAPSEAADAIALQNDVLNSDLEQNLTPVFNSSQPGAYPVSAYSYLLMAEQSEIPASKQAVEAQYVQFLACAGQEAAGKLGYSPLPLNLVQADFDAVGRITGTPLAPPTAANCPDPYITGAFNAGGAAGSGPTITTSTVGGGAAASPVAAAAAGAKAAGGGASGGGAAAGTSAKGATAGSGGSSTTTTVPVSTTTTTAAVAAASGQQLGEAMAKESGRFLGFPGPSLVVVVATVLFLALLAVPPLIGLSRRRRVASGEPESSDAADA